MEASTTGPHGGEGELWSCVCYVCGEDALWEIKLSAEDEGESAFACETHARGHVHVAIVLPEEIAPRAPYVGET